MSSRYNDAKLCFAQIQKLMYEIERFKINISLLQEAKEDIKNLQEEDIRNLQEEEFLDFKIYKLNEELEESFDSEINKLNEKLKEAKEELKNLKWEFEGFLAEEKLYAYSTVYDFPYSGLLKDFLEDYKKFKKEAKEELIQDNKPKKRSNKNRY